MNENDSTKEHLEWQLKVNAALAELYKPLISPGSTIEEITQVILTQAKKLTGSEHGYVAYIEPHTKNMVACTLTQMLKDQCPIPEENQKITFSIGSDGRYGSLWGHALNVLEPFYTNAPSSHPASVGIPLGHVPIEGFLTVPVIMKNELMGQIALANPGGDYSEKDLEAVIRLGEYYALALQHWRMETALHERQEELVKHREQLETLVKERTADLASVHERLREAQKIEALGTLAGGISHNFSSIIGAIIGYTELAMKDIPEDTITGNNLKQVLTAAHRAKEMVSQILAFSRKSKEERKQVQFNEIIEESVNFLKTTLPGSINVSLSKEKNPSPLTANPTQLQQVIMNICTNAVHAMKEKGGFLTLELKEEDHHTGESVYLAPGKYQHLSISDTGHGMGPDILKRVFEPYFTSKEVGEGTGMGLAVVHGIVTSHGGEVTAESEPGKGSTFHVYFPTTVP